MQICYRFLFIIRNSSNNHTLIIMKNRILALAALFCASGAFGAGFQVLEQGAGNIGSALAGATANANGDASAAFWNPSSLFFSGFEVGDVLVDSAISFVVPNFDFHDMGSTDLGQMQGAMPAAPNNGGNGGKLGVVPNFYVVYRASEDLGFTLSVTSTYGLATEFDENWVGRFHGVSSDMKTIDINPSVAYRVNDWFAVNAGISAQFIHAELTQAYALAFPNFAMARLTAQSWGVGGNAGFTIKYADDGRIGFSWRSEVSQSPSGNMRVNGDVVNPACADINLPHSFNVGVYQRLRGDFSRFAVMADYSYTLWSAFDRLTIKNEQTGSTISDTVEAWSNVSRISVGMHYHPEFDENLVFRFGTTWDQSPIKNERNRTVRIPCADRIWFACGVGYKYQALTIDIGYMYIWFYDNPMIENQGPTGTIKGQFQGRASVISAQLSLKF